MWSNKKYINVIINILLFMTGINFMHYGQLILPVICLILFIDNKFKIKLNNIKVFIVLCLFGISFCLFSYKMGYYCVMGFTLPMAYYIGSNFNGKKEDEIKYVIYLFGFSMAFHIVLNALYEYKVIGSLYWFFSSQRRYDFWTKGEIAATSIGVNYTIILSCLYFLLAYEKNKTMKITGLLLILAIMIYDLGLGRRAPLLMFVLSILISLFFDSIVFKNKKINLKYIIIPLVAIALTIVLGTIIYNANLFGFATWFESLVIVRKIRWVGLNPERLQIFIQAIKLAPEHLWGGRELLELMDNPVHDLWMDTFDYAGIIPYVLLVIYSIYYLIEMIKIIKNNNISKSLKVLFVTFLLCITMQMFLEPIMTGSSLFLLCCIIIGTCIESYSNNI